MIGIGGCSIGFCECDTSGVGCHVTGVRVNCHVIEDRIGRIEDRIGGDGGCGTDRNGVDGGGTLAGCVDRVNGDITGGKIDGDGVKINWFMLWGVVHDGTEAQGLINLRCPVEPCRL